MLVDVVCFFPAFVVFSEKEYEKSLSILTTSKTSLQFAFLGFIHEVIDGLFLNHSTMNIPPGP